MGVEKNKKEKKKAPTADCLWQLSHVLRAAVTDKACLPKQGWWGEFPSRAVAVVYERATSLAASDPIRWGSSCLGWNKAPQGPAQLSATHRDLVAGVREVAFKVTFRKDYVILRSSFGLTEKKKQHFVSLFLSFFFKKKK